MTTVHTIDLDFQGVSEAIASYLVQEAGSAVLVETGPASTLGGLRAKILALGFDPAELEGVLVTHIHLDHAGAAGWFARQGVPVYVHPLGAPHLVDPSRLLRSAGRIYGAAMGRLWGETVSAPAEQVRAVEDGATIEVAGLGFTAVETPGHAGHHHCWQLGDVLFSGDIAGVRLPKHQLVALPAPPPEIDVEAWTRSIDRLEGRGLTRLYPTHFGPSNDVGWHLATLRSELRDAADTVRDMMDSGLERGQIVSRYRDWSLRRARKAGLSEQAFMTYETANPLDMSVDGLMRYWSKRQAI